MSIDGGQFGRNVMNSFSYLGNCGTFEIYYYKGETVKEK
jgi:hypothetical protein